MTHYQQNPLITILGPTASGKTKLGVGLAEHFQGEIISADSRQVYRGMDIGTGKDLEEYKNIPYHLIDIIDPQHEYNLFQFAKDFCRSYLTVSKKGKLPLLVGGTGLYLDAILSRYILTIANTDEKSRQQLKNKTDSELCELLTRIKPENHNQTDMTNRDRTLKAIDIAIAKKNNKNSIKWPDFKSLIIGIKIERSSCKERISSRLKIRLKEGMIDEVNQLYLQGLSWQKLDSFGLEYRYITQYLKGDLNYNDMYQKLNSAIHLFAKQQEKWFRKIESKGHEINWLSYDDNLLEKATSLIEPLLMQ